MTALVADVGGTNTRIALVGSNGIRQSKRYENQDFTSFYEIVQTYVEEVGDEDFTQCCIALAGPILGTEARLTNRDWGMTQAGLKEISPSLRRVRFINDLCALGHALPHLTNEHLSEVWPPLHPPRNTQQLVLGIGTGVNCCLKIKDQVVEAELGHASVSERVLSTLRSEFGTLPEHQTIEDVFSGPGIETLHHRLTGETLSGAEIGQQSEHSKASAARKVMECLSVALADLTRDLSCLYLPMGGIYFAGSVSQSLLCGPTKDRFLSRLAQDIAGPDLLDGVGIQVITDDAAALFGAAHVARAN